MTPAEFAKLIEETHQKERDILTSKGKEYARSATDVLANFKRTAESLGVRPEQAWGSHFIKHVDAILSYVKNEKVFSSEGIEGRIYDAANYLLLLLGILKEKNTEILVWKDSITDFRYAIHGQAGAAIQLGDYVTVRPDGKMYPTEQADVEAAMKAKKDYYPPLS